MENLPKITRYQAAARLQNEVARPVTTKRPTFGFESKPRPRGRTGRHPHPNGGGNPTAGILVNPSLRNSSHFGEGSRFRDLPKGVPSLSLLDLLPDQLRTAVGAAIHRPIVTIKKSPSPDSLPGIGARPGSEYSVLPIGASRRHGPFCLSIRGTVLPKSDSVHPLSPDVNKVTQEQIEALEAELRGTKENLQATIEELETTNEELRCPGNEELQSTNEELHSVNEEHFHCQRRVSAQDHQLTEPSNDMDNFVQH